MIFLERGCFSFTKQPLFLIKNGYFNTIKKQFCKL